MKAIYLRVSSNQQTTRSQEGDLTKWATGQEDVAWYRDKQTGKNMERPGFNKLLADIRAGKITQVVIWRLDRLGRTAKGLLTFIEDELIARNVGFISLKDSIDLSTPAGRLLVVVLSGVAQFETEVRSERQRAGIQAAREQGKRWGGRPIGTRITITEEKEELVKKMATDKEPVAKIARITGLTRQSVYKILGKWERKPLETA